MKKVINIILVMIIAVGIAGCGTNKQTKQNEISRDQKIEMRKQRLDKALKEVTPSIQRMEARIEAKDYQGAISDCSVLTQQESKNPMLYIMCGRAYSAAGDMYSATKYFDKAQEVSPNSKMVEFEKKRAEVMMRHQR